MTTQQRIDTITAQLRDICNTDNDGPRLIAEMIEREFPHSLDLAMRPITEELEEEAEAAREGVEKLEATIESLESKIEYLMENDD